METRAQKAETIDTILLLKVLTAFKKGDFSARLPVEKTGTVGKIYDALNDVIECNENLTNELVRVYDSVVNEGKIGVRAALSPARGSWKICVDAVNGMLADLVQPVNEVARVMGGVAKGDLTQSMALEIDNRPLQGEFLRNARLVNTVVKQLGAFASEVTRMAREVGTEGKLGGQADVDGMAGVWKDLTESVNSMAGNLTSQVRNIALVTTAVAKGDLSTKITVMARGEFLELKNTMNTMVDQLNAFTSEVTRMAREVGTEGRLGGQASVPGAAGMWRDLTNNVNQLAANLTTQVRAIAEVATAVTKGDLARSIALEAQGEMAALKDNVNEMILNLRETTRRNTEQDWLKSNLARFARMVQGQRNLLAFSNLVLSELAPLVGAQHGVFYFSESEGSERGTLKLFSSYAYRERKNVSNRFRLGEGLVGQCALEKHRILLTNVPSEYIQISSGLGEGAPLNVIVLPVQFEGDVKAVIELASFSSYSEIHLAFLDQLTESIGIALNTITATMRTEELLNQAQTLAAELQSRQEDLTGTNKQLEQQATTSQASEDLLKKQQEQLRLKNEELQEKAKLLADQKTEVEVKNDQVEQARQDLEDKAAQLTLASKYKSEFLANMSHELRTPLNNLLIVARLLADNPDGNLTEKQTKFAQTIHSSGTDLLTLINDILDLARVESGKMNIEPAAVRLDDLREQVIQDFAHVAQSKGIEFGVRVETGLPDSIQTDPTRLHQILKNLMSNALKFTERGAVRMEIKLAKSGWRPGTSGLDRAERVVAFSVVDTGIGIPPEKQRIVFEAFQQVDGTTSRRYGGTGLGLSISRDIAQLLGGDLTLQSQVGVGSTFTLFLPAIRCKEMRPPRPAAGVEAIPAAPARPLPQRLASACDAVAMSALARMVAAQEPVEDDHLTLRKTDRPVLIVENDATFASMLLEKVHARGLKGVVVMRGGPVVRMVREMAPVAVTLDILLPDMSGWVVLEALKRDPATRHVPVHVVTICEERRRAMTMGAASFLHKTLNPGELDAVFDRILNELKTPVRNVLVVDGDPARGPSLVELLGNGDIQTIPAASGAEVSAALREHEIGGAVLGWNVPGLAGLDLLATLRDATGRGELRVLIYPAAPLSQAEKDGIAAWDDAAVIQIASSPEDLLDKSMTMFHRKEAELPREKRDKLAAARAVDQKLSGRKILIVDDDLRNIFALTSALETHEMNLTVAENGRKGIEALRANPDVELVLMDIMLPEMDGYQAMKAIRKMPEYRELPVIALTAQAMKGDRERCIEAGATDYIAKPVEIDQLLALMRVWLPEAQKA